LGYDIVKLSGINAFNPSWKFKLLNVITFGHFTDTKSFQFVCVVKKQKCFIKFINNLIQNAPNVDFAALTRR
jgi:hypothetical protein